MTKTKADAPAPDAPDNMRFWDQLGKTDPRHTKAITGRGFDGTAIKPMWQNKRLTELFGPCGIGWGFDKPDFTIVDGAVPGERLVYCTVRGWYDPGLAEPGSIACVYGVGGDKIITTTSTGKIKHDDEAFKKAFTDAIGNAFKFIGVAADVHMGLFDDSKYVQDLRAEFEAADDTLGAEIDAMLDRIKDCPSLDELTKLNAEIQAELKPKLIDANRAAEWREVVRVYQARRAGLASKPKAVPVDDGKAEGPAESESESAPAGS